MSTKIKRCLVCGRCYHALGHTKCLCGSPLADWTLPKDVQTLCGCCGKEILSGDFAPMVHWDTEYMKNEDFIVCGNCAKNLASLRIITCELEASQ